MVEGPKDHASGDTQINTSTIRAVHIPIPSRRNYRSAPAKLQQNFLNEVKEVRRSLYDDCLITGATTVVETQHLKQAAQAILREGRFLLYIWHSNVLSLEEPPSSEKAAEEHSTTQQEASYSLATPVEETPGQQPTTVLNTSQSFAKYYMVVKMGETKLLGRPWNKTVDTIEVAFPVPIVKV